MPCDSARPSVLTDPYSDTLRALGLANKAKRLNEVTRQLFYRDSSGAKWSSPITWESELRTTHRYAQALAREHYQRLLPAQELIADSSFCTMRFSVLFAADVTAKASPEKLAVLNVRRLLKRLMPNYADMIGSHGQHIDLKVLSPAPMTRALADQIQTALLALPGAIKWSWTNHPADQYRARLRWLVAPDLPKQDSLRARLEFVISHMRQLSMHGTVYMHMRSANNGIPPNSPQSRQPFQPINPKTGLLATHYTTPRTLDVTADMIGRHEWIEFIDYVEQDATTPAEYAEMAASIST